MSHENQTTVRLAALLLAVMLAALMAQQNIQPAPPRAAHLKPIEIVDVPGYSEEILAYCASQQLLLATNPHWKTLDMFEVESLDPPRLNAIDFDDDMPGAQGQSTLYEPTSVAVHPDLPVALVVVLGHGWNDPGRVVGRDLRKKTRGMQLFSIQVGIHPDSIAISPDGRWAIIACEAEADDSTPGSIWAIDLSALSLDDSTSNFNLPARQVGDLGALLYEPVGEIEPEFVGMDPQSRFALVSCQENDALVLVDLRGDAGPKLAGFTRLGPSSQPDGCTVLDNVPHPDDPARLGCLLAAVEEGTLDKFGDRMGQNLTLLWVDPAHLEQRPVICSITNIPTILGDTHIGRRRDPENVLLLRRDSRLISLVSVERGDYLLALDITDVRKPMLCDRVKVGNRPEGLIAIADGRDIMAVTGDEGDDNQGAGTLSFTRLSMEEK